MVNSRLPWITFLVSFSLLQVSTGEQTVNILVFYENPAILSTFDLVTEYIKETPSLEVKVGSVYKVQVNGSNNVTLMYGALCKDTSDAINKPDGERPDIIIDLTQHGIATVAVKYFAKTMHIPAISGSLDASGKPNGWAKITRKMSRYLVFITPPALVLKTGLFPTLCKTLNLTNFAILVGLDKEYGLALSIQMQLHVAAQFSGLSISNWKYIDQYHIDLLVTTNFTNFFVSGNINKIAKILEIATDPEMRRGPYNNQSFSWYSMSAQTKPPSCSRCKGDINVIHFSPKVSEGGNKRREFLNGKGYKIEDITDLFYFDIATNAILSIGKLKKDGKWSTPQQNVCSFNTTIKDDYELDLYSAIKSDDINGENALGPFYILDDLLTPGRSHATFEMNINLLKYVAGHPEPESDTLIGTFKVGPNMSAVMSYEGHEAEWKAHRAVTA